MAELRTSLVINLAGDLERRADAFSNSFKRVGSAAQAGFRLAESSAATLGNKLSWLGSKWMLISGGLGAAALIRATLTLDQRLERLGAQANASSQEVKGLWEQLNAISELPEIKADPSQVLGAIEEIVERTGDLKFVRDNLRNIAEAIQATGASGGAIGGLMSEFQKMGLGTKQVAEAVDIFHAAGKEGAFTLRNLASLGPRVVAAYTATGRTGLPAVHEMAAALQVIRRGTGTSDEAVTAFEAIMRVFGDKAKVQALVGHGVQVYDPEQLAQGRQMIRPLPDLMKEIVEAAQGRMTNLSTVFDAEAMRGFNSIVGEYQKTGKIESLAHFMAIRGGGGTAEDAARIARTTGAKIEGNRAAALAGAENYLNPVLERGYGALAAAAKGDALEATRQARQFVQSALPPAEGEWSLHKSSALRRLLSGTKGTIDRINAWPREPEAPQGKVTIEVKAAPGTSARVVGRPQADGMDLDVDSGKIMVGP